MYQNFLSCHFSNHGTRQWNSVEVKWLWRILQSSGRHEHDAEHHCPCLTVEQLLYWSDWIWTGRAAQIQAKTKFRFGNIVPKQWTLLGFIQHTSANSMYKDNNKISQQQKVLHMNKMLERVTHFQTSFSVGIQTLSWWNHHGSTHCVHHYPSINYIFSVFSNINGEHESTLTTSKKKKKYSWCIPVQKKIKPIIWGATITPEPWNRQQW